MIRKSSIFSNINDMLEDRGYEVDEVELENFLEDISDEEYFEIKKAIEKGQEDIIMEFIGDLPLRKKVSASAKSMLWKDALKYIWQENIEKIEKQVDVGDTRYIGNIENELHDLGEHDLAFEMLEEIEEGIREKKLLREETLRKKEKHGVLYDDFGDMKKTAQYGEFELYFDDLNNEAQNRLLAFMDLRDPAEGNFDVAPIAIIDYELEEEFEFEESISEEPRRRGKPLPDKERLERHKKLYPEEDIENEEDLPERGTGLGIRRRVTSTHKKKQQ